MFTTPGGKPASTISSESFRAVRGVISEGFKTMVFPVARAGPIFQLTIDCIEESSVKILSKKEIGDRDKPKGSSKGQFGPITGKIQPPKLQPRTTVEKMLTTTP
jgi:hypothetical protein